MIESVNMFFSIASLNRLVLLVSHLGGRAGYSLLVLPLSAGEHFLDRSIDRLLMEAYSIGMEVL
jgi:hypothetical protein